MTGKDFVTFLVDETLKLQKSGEVELSSLDHKLKDYELNYLRGEFIPQWQVLHFKTPLGDLDIPINWSVFATENSQSDYALIDEASDTDHLFSVIKNSWQPSMSKLLIMHADGFCYMVGLEAGDETHLHDLLNPQEWLKSA